MAHDQAQSVDTVETLRALEWGRVIAALAEYARSEPGRAHCSALPIETSIDASRTRLAETDEMVLLSTGTDPFPSLPLSDLREVLSRVSKGGTVEPLELRDLAVLLRLAEDVLRFVGRRRAEAPAIAALTASLPPLPTLSALRAEVEWVIEPDGTMKDSASPELRRLTQQVHDLKQSMRRRVEAILQSSRYEGILQEQYVAQREGRYVVPIKAEMRTAIPGIVHDISASGATVFLEPRELVDLNNGIKVAELAVDREVRRILLELARQIAEEADALSETQRVLVLLDVIQAKAALALRLGGRPVQLNEDGRVRLLKARHPILALSRTDVVANDVVLEGPARIMVISGANTGGKTVTLKLVGLFALMVRSGLLLPCEGDSEMAWFDSVYADIGDAQDLTKDLSSFSSHVTRTIRLLQAIEADQYGHPSGGRWLVLLDEPMTSTDPAEGAALAQALLQRLAQRGVTGLVTTHYTELKALAQEEPGFVNASVEFDVARLAPTYRLIAGVPGGSSAIEIAGRLGMDPTLLERARTLLQADDLSLEHLLNDLQTKQRLVAEALQQAEARRREADAAAEEATQRLDAIRDAEAAERRAVKKKLAEEGQRARAAILAAVEEVKRERAAERVKLAKLAKEKIASAEAAVSAASPGVTHIPVEQLAVGDRVEVLTLGGQGTLVEAPAGRARVRVRVGTIEMSVPVQDLVAVDAPTPRRGDAAPRSTQTSPNRPHGTGPRQYSAGSIVEPALELDVRGLAADEALDALVGHLDRAVLGGAPWLRLIHGHGTGKLKSALREHLRTSPYVATFRPGERGEGGDGVTMVELTR